MSFFNGSVEILQRLKQFFEKEANDMVYQIKELQSQIEQNEKISAENQTNIETLFKILGVEFWETIPCVWDESLKKVTVYGGDAKYFYTSPWKDKYEDEVQSIEFLEPVRLTGELEGRLLFSDMPNLTEIKGLDLIDTSNLTYMWAIFRDTQVESVDISKWNVSKCTNFSDMFFKSSKIKELDFANWEMLQDVEDIDFGRMFMRCTNLSKLDISSFNIGSQSYIWNMLGDCNNLSELTLGSKSILTTDANLPKTTVSGHTGRWIGKETGVIYESSEQLMENYDGTQPDTFVAEVLQEVG